MSEHTHHDHSVTEAKPVSFTVPFILAAVVIFAVVMFLSLCDPKPHHGAAHEAGTGHTATEATVHGAGTNEGSAKAESSIHEPAASPADEHH